MRYEGVVMITDFKGMCYFESGYLLPGYTNSMPYNHPLDRQGHIALTPLSGAAAYTSYIRLVTTGIPITIEIEEKEIHRFYFDLVGLVPAPHDHNIWRSLHFLPLVSNVFLSRYDSRTFLSHLAEGEYGFDNLGMNCIDMYQMYLVVPTVCGGIPYVGVGLLYRSSNLHVGNIEDCTIFLKAFFAGCKSSVDVAPSQALFLRKT